MAPVHRKAGPRPKRMLAVPTVGRSTSCCMVMVVSGYHNHRVAQQTREARRDRHELPRAARSAPSGGRRFERGRGGCRKRTSLPIWAAPRQSRKYILRKMHFKKSGKPRTSSLLQTCHRGDPLLPAAMALEMVSEPERPAWNRVLNPIRIVLGNCCACERKFFMTTFAKLASS